MTWLFYIFVFIILAIVYWHLNYDEEETMYDFSQFIAGAQIYLKLGKQSLVYKRKKNDSHEDVAKYFLEQVNNSDKYIAKLGYKKGTLIIRKK